MSDAPPEPSKDSLGLDIGSLKLDDNAAAPPGPASAAEPETPAAFESASDAAQPAEDAPATEAAAEDAAAADDKKQPPRERKKPYVNPERVKTGGAQRVRPSRRMSERVYLIPLRVGATDR